MITPAYGLTSTERVLPRMALDFTTATLDPRVTVTRALNTATRVNSSGLVEIINANLPRFDYDPTTLLCKGLLIEQSTTNQIAYSNDISNASWSEILSGTGAVTRTGNYAIAPDGTQTATRLQLSGASGGGNLALVTTSSFLSSAGVPETWSLWIKTNDNSTKSVHMSIAGVSATNMTVTGTWQRFSVTWPSPSASAWNGRVGLVGGSGSSTDADISVWGGQMEQLAFMTSLVPTTTAGTVRNADVVYMSGTNFSDWYNASEGTFVSVADTLSTTGHVISADNGVNERIFQVAAVGGAVTSNIVSGGTNTFAQSLGSITSGTSFKTAIAYKANNANSAVNAVAGTTDTTVTIPTIIQLRIGTNAGGVYLNGHVASLRYFSIRLTNAELQAFSK